MTGPLARWAGWITWRPTDSEFGSTPGTLTLIPGTFTKLVPLATWAVPLTSSKALSLASRAESLPGWDRLMRLAEGDRLQVGDQGDRDLVDLGERPPCRAASAVEGLGGGGQQVGGLDVGVEQLVGRTHVVAHGQQVGLEGPEVDVAAGQPVVADGAHVGRRTQHRAQDGVEGGLLEVE